MRKTGFRSTLAKHQCKILNIHSAKHDKNSKYWQNMYKLRNIKDVYKLLKDIQLSAKVNNKGQQEKALPQKIHYALTLSI